MPHQIQLDHVPAGYALNSGRDGEQMAAAVCEFTSSEDGQLFISRLEGIPRMLIEKLPPMLTAAASMTDNLLAIVRADKSAAIYYNECHPSITARAKKAIKKGDPVSLDDIFDVERVDLDGINVPEDAGICYVFSFGWRKGFFFDLGPCQSGAHHRKRDYDLGAVLGDCFARVLFQERFSILEATWEEMFRQRWFPFSSLTRDQVTRIIGFAREGKPIDPEMDSFRQHAIEVVGQRLQQWEGEAAFAEHLPIIRAAYQHFVAGDDLSATAILYPRIEGIIRSHQRVISPCAPLKQGQFSATASGAGHPALRPTSTFLPERFRQYLEEVYFCGFDPHQPATTASRHTIAHGVAPAASFDRKSATIGFLTLLQISTVIRMTSEKR